MTIFYIYALSCIALSGYGIVFLNAESILAVCFFIFFTLLLRNASAEGLDTTRQAIKNQLASCMYQGQYDSAKRLERRHYDKFNLLSGTIGGASLKDHSSSQK